MTNSVISGISKKTRLAYQRIKSAVSKRLEGADEDLQSLLLQIEESQRVAHERIRQMLDKTADLKKAIMEEDRKKLEACRNNISKFLDNVGVDPSRVDDFLRDPSPENLELLKEKFPKK